MFNKPRLRTILVIVNLAILILPISSIGILRIYESALVRQTESELIAQSAFITAVYQAAFEHSRITLQYKQEQLDNYGILITPRAVRSGSPWRPRPPVLDLTVDPVLPRAPEGSLSDKGDPIAIAIGRDISGLIKQAQITTLASIRLMDYQGIVVASTGEELGMNLAVREEIQQALQGKPVSLLRQRVSDSPISTFSKISRNTGIRVFVSSPVILNNRLIAIVSLSRTPKNVWQALNEKKEILFYVSLVLLSVVIAVSLITALKIGRPIRALIRQAQQAARGEKGAVTVLQNPGTWEVEQLSEAVSAMAQNLEHRADYIREFAAHVSHEFKTPLTAIRGAVELLDDHADNMSKQARKKFYSNLLKDARRLESLVTALLQLAKADVISHSGAVTDLCEVLDSVITRYRDNGANIEWDNGETRSLMVAIDNESTITIVSNLLDNAIHHGGEDVKIKISLSEDTSAEKIHMTVCDNGPGISQANIEQIFEPFFTTARKRGGTGLGLSIIRSLLQAHGGDIQYKPANPGAGFEAVFKMYC